MYSDAFTWAGVTSERHERSAGWGWTTALWVDRCEVYFVAPVQRQVAIGLGVMLKEWHPVEEQLGLFYFSFTGAQQFLRTGCIPGMSRIFSTVGAVFAESRWDDEHQACQNCEEILHSFSVSQSRSLSSWIFGVHSSHGA